MTADFAVDPSRAKLLGVCAGLARTLGVDPFPVRLATGALTLLVAPAIIPLYLLTAWIAPSR